MDLRFDAEVFQWRGPAPFYWCSVPAAGCAEIRDEAEQASYGWGAVPVRVGIGATEWETSLLPRDDGYVLPLKTSVRTAERIDDGDTVTVRMSIAPRGGRAANGTGPAV